MIAPLNKFDSNDAAWAAIMLKLYSILYHMLPEVEIGISVVCMG